MTSPVGEARAGSKVILLGEHTVVHGTDALVLGLAKGTRVQIEPHDGHLCLSEEAWGLQVDVAGGALGDESLRQLANALGAPLSGARLVARVEVPPRAGLGSSASLAAACARALNDFFELGGDRDTILAAVDASEKVFHQNPSGVDARAVLQEGCLTFNRRAGVTPLAAAAPPLLVFHSGEDGETRRSVASFARKLGEEKCFARNRVEYVDELVKKGTRALGDGDWAELGRIMDANHGVLQWFGVSTEKLDDICTIARANGALGAKMTGGGGGGCAIVLASDDQREAVATAVSAAGYRRVL